MDASTSVARRGMTTGLAVALLGLGLALPGAVRAQDAAVEFTVSGNSTVRGWTCTVSGTAAVTGSGTAMPGLGDGVGQATLTVPVGDFVCPEDEMEEHLLEAMRATEFPEITFVLQGYEASPGGAITRGTLTILDTTREVSFPVAMGQSDSGARLQGELALDMTDYGVEPPVVMGGLLRVRPQIRIEFSGTVSR